MVLVAACVATETFRRVHVLHTVQMLLATWDTPRVPRERYVLSVSFWVYRICLQSTLSVQMYLYPWKSRKTAVLHFCLQCAESAKKRRYTAISLLLSVSFLFTCLHPPNPHNPLRSRHMMADTAYDFTHPAVSALLVDYLQYPPITSRGYSIQRHAISPVSAYWIHLPLRNGNLTLAQQQGYRCPTVTLPLCSGK